MSRECRFGSGDQQAQRAEDPARRADAWRTSSREEPPSRGAPDTAFSARHVASRAQATALILCSAPETARGGKRGGKRGAWVPLWRGAQNEQHPHQTRALPPLKGRRGEELTALAPVHFRAGGRQTCLRVHSCARVQKKRTRLFPLFVFVFLVPALLSWLV